MIDLRNAAKYYKELPHQAAAFAYLQKNIDDGILSAFAEKYRTPLPPKLHGEQRLETDNDFIKKILLRIHELGIKLIKPPSNASDSAHCINIIGLEGLNPDFSLNDDKPNHFNDLFLILGVKKDGNVKYLQKSIGTTEPGSHYTYNPLNKNGAARVVIDKLHEKIWKVGTHGRGRSAHTALVQIGNEICVSRDANRDFARTNDKIYCGYFGINFHHGYDMALNNIGRASAGCQVIRSSSEHKAAMDWIKTDYYYSINKDYRFSYILLDSSKIFGEVKKHTKYEKSDEQTEKLALDLIIKWECGGDVSKYLSAYADPAHGWNVPTIGIGTIKYPDGRKVKKGDKITEEQAKLYCIDYIRRVILPHLRQVPQWDLMHSYMQAALISFAYNLGNFYGSSGFNTLSSYLKSSTWSKIPEALMLYVKAGGKTLQGLVNRRKDEANYWQKGLNIL